MTETGWAVVEQRVIRALRRFTPILTGAEMAAQQRAYLSRSPFREVRR